MINTGLTGEQNVSAAREAVYKLIGDNKIVGQTELKGGGMLYKLEGGTTITFRPEASVASDLMPKIMINSITDGVKTIVNLVFYP